uniref:Heat shock 70 kDa protein 12A n=1 Tax=Magallana gigas TaxID=29159 RepID=K1PLR3_MAGGI
MADKKDKLLVAAIDFGTTHSDDIGKEAPALNLFAHVIRYLKNHLLSVLDTKGTEIINKDIHWVLPVPAIWKNSAKRFMREAANRAKLNQIGRCEIVIFSIFEDSGIVSQQEIKVAISFFTT